MLSRTGQQQGLVRKDPPLLSQCVLLVLLYSSSRGLEPLAWTTPPIRKRCRNIWGYRTQLWASTNSEDVCKSRWGFLRTGWYIGFWLVSQGIQWVHKFICSFISHFWISDNTWQMAQSPHWFTDLSPYLKLPENISVFTMTFLPLFKREAYIPPIPLLMTAPLAVLQSF